MESYIIRIYRRDKDAPYNIIGLVEDVELEEKKPFHNTEELAEILVAPHPIPLPQGERGKGNGRRRRNNRLKLRLPVRIEGIDAMGDKFTEEAIIKNISSYGAYISMKNHVGKDAGVSLIIDPEDSCLNMRARVVRIEKGRNKTGVGVAFI
ncbi:MAG: PilZ domain-containing protein [Nitrospirota bacterium]